MIKPIIICGGSGTRLWPLSRQTKPKQFIKLGSESSLFQQILERLKENPTYSTPIIVTNADYRFRVAEQAREIGIELGAILLEPTARNTAPAIAAAVLLIAQQDSDSLVQVFPSDHLIDDNQKYLDAVKIASSTANSGFLLTFGIKPDKPVTGYGYIKAGKSLETGAYKVERFIEKPDLESAKAMLSEDGYSWNSGMFLFRADNFIAELGKFEPDIVRYTAQSVEYAVGDLDFLRLDKDTFNQCPEISIDYALFEKTKKAAVVTAEITWSDVGSWRSFYESRPPDFTGNATIGNATYQNASNNLVISGGQHIAMNGVSDLVVVATDDAILISDMASSENIKEIVTTLKSDVNTKTLTEEHKTTYRPWGGYVSILSSDRFHVKKLFVTPGKKLSLQKHYHRAEHWVVVSGTAEITIDEKILNLPENESCYIPVGAVHRLANPGKVQLEVIEVQLGSYLGEDDIVRIEDDFGRISY